ncbi:MAG: triose-phosphate isomerase [Desulfurococcales archaeon]|nr:triose-phosphate isomerase [Desulfurococcales archaeon]
MGGNVEVVLIPPPTEIRELVKVSVKASIFAQHVDPVNEGAYTGHITLEMIKDAGAEGVMINHSERKVRADEVERVVKKAKSMGLRTLVCADTPTVAAALSLLAPEMVAVEPPELIGTGISVSKAKPEVITDTVQLIKKVSPNVRVLTGAGVSTAEDVIKAIELGSEGVLVASAVMKAHKPEDKIRELAGALLKGR